MSSRKPILAFKGGRKWQWTYSDNWETKATKKKEIMFESQTFHTGARGHSNKHNSSFSHVYKKARASTSVTYVYKIESFALTDFSQPQLFSSISD